MSFSFLAPEHNGPLMFRVGHPGNANLLIGATLPANREIGVPEMSGLRQNRFKGLRFGQTCEPRGPLHSYFADVAPDDARGLQAAGGRAAHRVHSFVTDSV